MLDEWWPKKYGGIWRGIEQVCLNKAPTHVIANWVARYVGILVRSNWIAFDTQIKLQRIWTHHDIANLKVYKLPKQAPSFRSASLARDVRSCLTPLPRSLTLKISGEYLRGNVLGQFILKAEVNALVAYRHQWVCFAHRVDAGSRMQKFLMGRSLRMEEKISKRKHGIYVKLDAKPAGSFTSEIYNSLESSLRKVRRVLSDSSQRKDNAGCSATLSF